MRYYSSIAQAAQLSGGVNNLVTSIAVSSLVGFPTSVPFTIAVDPSTAYEEIMTVTVVSGTTLTVTRGEDFSTAVSHSAGAEVRHIMSARDLREPQEHIVATQNIHGIGAGNSVVGTGTAQALTNKTLDAAAIATGVLGAGRIPAQTYASLTGTPTTFAPSARTDPIRWWQLDPLPYGCWATPLHRWWHVECCLRLPDARANGYSAHERDRTRCTRNRCLSDHLAWCVDRRVR